ncbi:hypothetical protein [Shimia abyssi]|uniref:hypothetical protein n=1 Tax=Shimia abyssi TaxID=1662395 RepID=UPI0010574619|nr:hypothetical protein [Shimia abyssi]
MLTDALDGRTTLPKLENRIVFISTARDELRDSWDVAGGVSVQTTGTFLHRMALDNFLALGRSFKTDQTDVFGFTFNPGWGVFLFSYLCGVFMLIGMREPNAPRNSSELRRWFGELIGLIKFFPFYIIFVFLSFWVLDWGFLQWATSLSIGSVAGAVSALRVRFLQ